MTTTEEVIFLARKFSFVREVGGPNKGLWVELFQQFTGNKPGDSWCASFVSYVLAVVFGGYTKSPLPRTASCDTLLDAGRAGGWLSNVASVGDVFLYLHTSVDAHHAGFVTEIDEDGNVMGIAGNTSIDGKSSNGDGVYEHLLTATPGKIIFLRYPR